MLLELGHPDPHRRGQVLPRRPASQIPHLDQQFHRVIPIRRSPRCACDRPGGSLPGFRCGQRTPRVRPRPTRRGDQLIQHHPFSFLARPPILGGMLLRDFSACTHRQFLTHPLSTPQHPHDGRHFASIYEMRHAPHFASTFSESRRPVASGLGRNRIDSGPIELRAVQLFRKTYVAWRGIKFGNHYSPRTYWARAVVNLWVRQASKAKCR